MAIGGHDAFAQRYDASRGTTSDTMPFGVVSSNSKIGCAESSKSQLPATISVRRTTTTSTGYRAGASAQGVRHEWVSVWLLVQPEWRPWLGRAKECSKYKHQDGWEELTEKGTTLAMHA